MANQTNQIVEEIREAKIKLSSELWAKFDEWKVRQGCPTLADGIRTAIRQVTQFNTVSQEKNGR